MNERMIQNFKRFKAYTKKLAIICLGGSGLAFLLFPQYLWIGGILFVASISALGHYAYLKISIHNYEQNQNK